MLISQCHNEEATAKARKDNRDFSPTAFLRIGPADTVMSGNRLPDLPSTSPTSETLPRACPRPISFHHPSQTLPTVRSISTTSSLVAVCVHSSTTPPCSDPKRPSKDSASGSHSGYMSQLTDNTRPIGSSASSADRSGRDPYHKGKGADKSYP